MLTDLPRSTETELPSLWLATDDGEWFSPPLNRMNQFVKACFVAGVLLLAVAVGRPALAADAPAAPAANANAPAAPPQPSPVIKQLRKLVDKINGKLSAGVRTQEELAAEFKEFDALLAEHKQEKTEDVAQIAWMKAMLYLQVFQDMPKGKEALKSIATDFPATKVAAQVPPILANIERVEAKQEASRKAAEAMMPGKPFPDFNEKDINGQPLSIAKYKGKVVLVDFWATWCGPCMMELPNVLSTYAKYHSKGFEIVGISLDKDIQGLKDFIKSKEMTWAQYCDGQVWESKLALNYGVMGIPATWLLDAQGKIIGRDLRGPMLEAAVAEALGKK